MSSSLCRLFALAMLGVAVTAQVAGAQAEAPAGDVADPVSATIDAIQFDPWEIQEEEIEPRRDDVVAYVDRTQGLVDAAEAATAEAEAELLVAEGLLAEAVEHRADMELEVEGFSIAIWELGDLGLQEVYNSEAERARQAETVIAATEALVERVEDADAAIVAAEDDVAQWSAAVAELEAEERAANGLLRRARQIRDRFEAMITARSEAIDRWSHEALESESEEIEFVTITSVTVEVPIETPAIGGADGDEVAQAALPDGAGAQTGAVPTRSTTVAIPPIIVNAEIAGQVQALIGAARADGINLHGGGYRPVADQIILRVAHCGTSGYDIFEKPAGECEPPTATPGNSQHELGLAVDFTVDGGIVTPGSPAFAWLVANAGSYGLINLPSEAWHWSTTGG